MAFSTLGRIVVYLDQDLGVGGDSDNKERLRDLIVTATPKNEVLNYGPILLHHLSIAYCVFLPIKKFKVCLCCVFFIYSQ